MFTADPNIEPKAIKISKVSFEEMLEMSSMGSKVLHTRSVELAMKNNLTLQVLSSLTNQEGTYVVDENKLIFEQILKETNNLEKTDFESINIDQNLLERIFKYASIKHILEKKTIKKNKNILKTQKHKNK